ncbi:hypothetical protein ABS755_10540 [Castellaniella sp. FW104-16D08]|jgi:flagellar protein FlhE|uniref:hypothetical protein n=1 Tax=unclassified Castellaniella TaxID=2617606 RepID=UPI003314FB64
MKSLYRIHPHWAHRAAATLAACLLGSGHAMAGDPAWTQDRTSEALHTVGQPVSVVFKPDAAVQLNMPVNAVVTHVYAARRFDSTAQISTQLCHGLTGGSCVPLQGSHINTGRFDGQAATGPWRLVHKVLGWGNDHPPVFVRDTIIVWYTAP